MTRREANIIHNSDGFRIQKFDYLPGPYLSPSTQNRIPRITVWGGCEGCGTSAYVATLGADFFKTWVYRIRRSLCVVI